MADHPRRIRLSRARGWRMPANTVKVDRSTRWGNPFIVGQHGGTRKECVRLYQLLMGGCVCLSMDNADEQIEAARHVLINLHELRGHNLACWCPLGAPCHADVLLELANGDT
ncbi:DUF4326 domain-containing protein [Arhodomonas sp. AD133]|uniref:DUF4326 domain-containing protein n=1 Tax=Arhodomonas sp. AD133 TaxID=3415009 RepID=UPI003EC073F4